ncbi:uncharacterized protein LOC144702867 [Wolffia australiana]
MAECGGLDGPKRRMDGGDSLPVAAEEDVPQAKRLRAVDLMLGDIFDDVDPGGDVDKVLRSLEEEILASTAPVSESDGAAAADLSYLLEASDDDLGLPPAAHSSSDGGEPRPDAVDIWRLDDDIPSFYYDFGASDADVCAFEPSDFADVSWRPESLPAV